MLRYGLGCAASLCPGSGARGAAAGSEWTGERATRARRNASARPSCERTDTPCCECYARKDAPAVISDERLFRRRIGAASDPALAEGGLLLRGAGSEGRAGVQRVHECSQAGEAGGIGSEPGMAHVHERGADGEVGDAERVAHEVLGVPELCLEILEQRCELLVGGLLCC